jgi:hypothetical protein
LTDSYHDPSPAAHYTADKGDALDNIREAHAFDGRGVEGVDDLFLIPTFLRLLLTLSPECDVDSPIPGIVDADE